METKPVTKQAEAKLRIVVTGGGSGGHITPVLAVAHELKLLRPDCEVIYVGQKGDSLGDVPEQDSNIDAVYSVRAGKFRRYVGESWRQVLDVRTIFLNLRDAVYVIVGILQSRRLLRRLKPSVIFTRGSFVSVPVCVAAGQLHIPYITHDSDAIPSLANRIIAKKAAKNAVALPVELYPYPAEKTINVGVPISRKFAVVDAATKQQLLEKLDLAEYGQVLLVTGGGLGARRLNEVVVANASRLLSTYPGLVIVHLSGRSLEEEVIKKYNDTLPTELRKRVWVKGFATNLDEYSAVADVVVTRAGGTVMAEFAAQAKACVVVPNPELTGGHQSKNAQALVDMQAIVMVEESVLAGNAAALSDALIPLLDNSAQAEQLGMRLHTVARPDSAATLATLLLNEAEARANADNGRNDESGKKTDEPVQT